MGIILSRFRRKLTSLEELEKIEEKIQDLEKYRNETEQRQKRVVGKFLIYSVGVYVLAAAVFYFLFFPASLRDRLFYIIPLLVFPIIVILVKKLISWYYAKRVTEQQDVLRQLRSDKRLLLERVMENETYKVARTILEKFAPDQLRNNNKLAIAGSNNTPTSNLRREQATIKAPPTTTNSSSTTTAIVPAVNSSVAPRTLTVNLPSAPGTELRHRTISTPQMHQILPQSASVQALQPAVPRARPVLPKESGFMDRLIESIVGDGPSYRYALICAQCHGHNGMALREEFPFLAFRCCYCSYFNQAKKQRPLSPRLLDKDEGEEMQRPPDCSSDSEPDSEAHTSENEDAQPDESKDCHRESADETGEPKVTESQHKSSDEENNQVSESSKKDAPRVD